MKSRPQTIRVLTLQASKDSGSNVDPSGVLAAIFNLTIANAQQQNNTCQQLLQETDNRVMANIMT